MEELDRIRSKLDDSYVIPSSMKNYIVVKVQTDFFVTKVQLLVDKIGKLIFRKKM